MIISATAREPIRLLLVEDEEVDRMALERALRKSHPEVTLTHAFDGAEGLARLRGDENTEALSRPHLVLLDLNMPGMGGIEFLDNLREDPKLRRTVVFVLTTSAHEEDRSQCYDRGVAGFIVKKNIGAQSSVLLDMIERYWNVVELPLQ